MVIHLRRERRCDRCGATKKEAPLTWSHSTHRRFKLLCNFDKHVNQKFKETYTLCERCRLVHLELERRALIDACARLAQLHEDYINQ